MAISKRLRFEILRRDGFACRYCGATAPDVQLHVDHVVPESLGGRDEPENLVASCAECNSGKASTHPDDQVVADAERATVEWKAAMEKAVAEHKRDTVLLAANVDVFDQFWTQWFWTDSQGQRHEIDRPVDWRQSVERMLIAGLPARDLERLVQTAMQKRTKGQMGEWRYFCGCAWRTIEAIQDRAHEIAKS